MPPRDGGPSFAPGMTLTPHGAHFAVYAGHADEVALAVLDDHRGEDRIPLAGSPDGWWFGHADGLAPGARYGVRARGPRRAEQGHWYDDSVLLLDPYARAIDHGGRAVLVEDTFDWGDDAPPRTPWTQTVIYEAHVRGLTMTHPAVPVQHRGTYAGVAHPAIIAHLQRIGVTAIELLPVHASITEPAIQARGLVNYWGYNTLGFFAPNNRYAAATHPQGVVDEFKSMVKALHAAGIEVILDVVYNHTAEQGNDDGQILSWRGLDNRAYYRLDPYGADLNLTGCGNSLNTHHEVSCRQVLDSMRYWVTEMHVDGFRFDLAVTLARGRNHDFDPDHAFFAAVRSDPVLGATKLIAEPWDCGMGGWRTGQFPRPFSEWNDRYRDDVRTFWLTDLAATFAGQPGHGARELATRLAGSQDLFWTHERNPTASINFVAAHDGFTAADLTAYNEKRNEGNLEGNRDGSPHNRSWNHGHEGATDNADTLAWRRRSLRNLLATLLVSAGVPMINAGDEFGRTQHGNNNAFCQDNEIGWMDWDWQPWQDQLVQSIAALAAIRRAHPVLQRDRFFLGTPTYDGGPADVSWLGQDARPLTPEQWEGRGLRTLSMLIGAHRPQDSDILVVVNGAIHDAQVTLPDVSGRRTMRLLWDSTWEQDPGEPQVRFPGTQVCAGPSSLQVWASETVTD